MLRHFDFCWLNWFDNISAVSFLSLPNLSETVVIVHTAIMRIATLRRDQP